MMTLEPLHQNVIVCFATLVYIKVVVGTCDFLVSKRLLSSDLSRKVVHINAGVGWCLFWPYFTQEHSTWRLNVAIPALYSVQLVVKGLVLQDPNDPDVKTMSRTGNPIELCHGPLLFTFVMIYCGLYQFLTDAGIYTMAALGLGDGVAPLMGKYFPYGYYQTFGAGQYKTLSGSLGMFVFTIVGVLVLSVGTGVPRTLEWVQLVGVALVATLAEAVSGKWDNVVIAAAVLSFLHATNAAFR